MNEGRKKDIELVSENEKKVDVKDQKRNMNIEQRPSHTRNNNRKQYYLTIERTRNRWYEQFQQSNTDTHKDTGKQCMRILVSFVDYINVIAIDLNYKYCFDFRLLSRSLQNFQNI